MASSHEQHHYNTTAAPPPTPSSQPNLLSTSSTSIDTLLYRLPPTLSLPTRRPPPHTSTVTPPIISLSDPSPTLHSNLQSAFQLGFFQLTHHSQLANSAQSDSLSLFNLSYNQKQLQFPQNWPIGFDNDDDDKNKTSNSFCFDPSYDSESSELKLTSLLEFTREMEKVGLEVIEVMSQAVGFDNPARKDPTQICSLMWVTQEFAGNMSGKMYPCVVGLQYQIRCQERTTMLSDSGWVSVLPQMDSILVTFGDIAQVWSNGKLKKVRGRPIPSLGDCKNSRDSCISMTLLLTLPLDTTVSTLVPGSIDCYYDKDGDDDCDPDGIVNISENKRLFNSFSFEDYAWRVYHERHVSKDPLDRYRIR